MIVRKIERLLNEVSRVSGLSGGIGTKYPELDKVATKLARDLGDEINRQAPKVKSEMPYREQYILEKIIEILKEAV